MGGIRIRQRDNPEGHFEAAITKGTSLFLQEIADFTEVLELVEQPGLTGQDRRVLELPGTCLRGEGEGLLCGKQTVVDGLEFALERQGEERPVLVEEGVVVLAIGGRNGGQTVPIDLPSVVAGVVVGGNPVGECLVEVEAGKIEIVVVELEVLLDVQFAAEELEDKVLDGERAGDLVGFRGDAVVPLPEFAEIALMACPEGGEFLDGATEPGCAGGDIRGGDVVTEGNAHQLVVLFVGPFIGDTDDCVGTGVGFEDGYEFREAAFGAGGHSVDFVEDHAEGAVSFGAEEVADVVGMKERLDEVFHRGFVAELAGVTFDGAETGVRDNAVGEGRFAGAGGAVEEGDDGRAGGGRGDPGEERIVVRLVEGGGPSRPRARDF